MIGMVILLALVSIICCWLYLNAEKIRARELEMREREPFKFMILGFSRSYLDDSNTWVRRYRIFVVILCACFYLFGFWFFMTVR
jgi:hypothetical protein